MLAAVASESPPDSPMADRMRRWIELGEAGDWATFFASMAQLMKAGTEGEAGSFAAAAALQPRPATPERFLGELRGTLDPQLVRDRAPRRGGRAGAGAGRRAGPGRARRGDADRRRGAFGGATLLTDPECGHTVRSSFRGYDDLVEAFLAEGD